MVTTANWVAVGFKCPKKEKEPDSFTFSVEPPKPTVAPNTTLELPPSIVVTPFTTDVPDILSEKSGFCVIVNVTTSGPCRLFVSVPLNVPFTGAMV